MASSSASLVGRVVAKKYRIRKLLGEGGMGAVYEAENVEIGRRVALKRLLPQVVERAPTSRARFLREARVAGVIGDERIIDVLDFVEDDDRSQYIVMELLAGESLGARLVRERTLGIAETLSIMRDVLGALGAAHSHGIVHRDIKPENIFLLEDDRVKLLDFGISKHLEASKLTATDALVGTPYYMSPEQAQGSGKVDHRSDLFSTGAVIFACVTGRVLFEGTSIGRIIGRLLTEEPPLLRSLLPDVPAELERALDRALAPSPDDRYASAADMWAALEPFAGSDFRSAAVASTVVRERPIDRGDTDAAGIAKTVPPPPKGPSGTHFEEPLFGDDPTESDGHLDRRSLVSDRAVELDLPDGYERKGLIGFGEMGEVFEIWDGELHRPLALKRARRDRMGGATSKQLIREAQLIAQLEHPNIVPIHALLSRGGGEPYLVMKRVHGRTLSALLSRLRGGDRDAMAHFDDLRLVITFLHVVEAIAHAHSKGVAHGDLSPSNILLGSSGEVLVTDWGCAAILDRRRPTGLRVLEIDEPLRVPGTLPYMAPEQAAGDGIDERTDIYALGAILYEILTLTRPCEPKDRASVIVTIAAGIDPPRARAPRREISPDLEEICVRAMSPKPGDRYASAEELSKAIEDHLTGARRKRTAERMFAEGERARQRWEDLVAVGRGLREQLAAIEARIKPYDGEAKKAPLWDVEQAVAKNELDAAHALAEALDRYGQAVGIGDGFAPAADRIADLRLGLFLSAEEKGDVREMMLHRREIERHHGGRHARLLAGGGSVTLRPRSDAAITAHRLVERGKRIVTGEEIRLPNGRVEDLHLPMGSYLFTLRAPGMRDVKLPIAIGRGTGVDLSPRMFREESIGAGFVHVPAGPFIYGGDGGALNSASREEITLDDFFIARHPTTCQEYLEFLNALAEIDPHRARTHTPRTKPDGGLLWEPEPSGRYVLPKLDADGNPVHPRAPVMGVSWYDAQAYADWRSQRGSIVRLPTEQEWEKAARGADGRIFPWGNGFDPTFCKMALSRPGRPQPEPVGSFPADVSVYGMADAAGAIREWCDSIFDPAGETRVLRGGAWYFNPAYCRLAFRHGYLPNIVFTNFGFRISRSPEGAG